MSGYIGNIPVPQATQTRQSFTATASQTTFNTAGYSVGYVDVFLNGVKLAPADYTATNGSDIILAVGAASGDILEIVAYEIFQVVDQDFTGDFTVDGTTFVVDSTNDRVGVGTASPSGKLDVIQGTTPSYFKHGTGTYLNITTGAANGTVDLKFDASSGSYPAATFYTGNNERMRISGTGHVLVGQSSTLTAGSGNTVTGFSIRNDGGFYASRSSGGTINANTNTDGEIAVFRKDGTQVGVIGTVSSELFIGTGSSGFYFDASNTAIKPRNVSSGTGSAADGTIDLGGTGNSFKDLYLSGGILADGISTVSTIRENVTTDTTTSGTLNISLLGTSVRYLTANQTANRTLNFRGDVSTSLNSIMAVGESITTAVLATQGSTAYYFNTIQIDTTGVTPKWQGGSAPTGGNASGIDAYSFTIIKTASATFTVLASLTQYA